MKFALASDLHLHFKSLVLENTESADALILAGDIFEVLDLPDNETHYVYEFYKNVSEQFPHVFLICGNHEHYGLSFDETHSRYQEWLVKNNFENIHLMNQTSILLNGVMFHGTTLWTDLKKNDPYVSLAVKKGMNDYKEIKNWSTKRQVEQFEKELNWLTSVVENASGMKNVVITHHQPTMLSIPPRYRPSEPLNYGYVSDLSEFILDHPQIDYWCAGHTHNQFEYDMGCARVICNPRGYAWYEHISSFFKLRYYDI